MALRCKLSGHDLNACGICKRCGDRTDANHIWKEAERTRECYQLEECENCDEVKETPQHDWTPTPTDAADGTGVELRCSRCNLKI